MLKELYIENLAIIEKAVISFNERLNVFSGETGAGKSILIGGINAVLGGRVSKDIVRAGAEKAVVSALFNVEDSRFENNELLLTREINSSGNSIARINGKTATAAELKEIAAGLIDVHGQHETRLITSRDVQLQLLDVFGNVQKEEYEIAFREFSLVSKKIKQLQKADDLREEKLLILSAKIADLQPFNLQKGQEDEVAARLNKLRNIAEISQMLSRAHCALSGAGEQFGAVDLLNISRISLGEAAKYIPECKDLKARLDSLAIELDDIKREIMPLVSDSADTEKLPKLEERMSDFLRLKRKYGLSIDELVDELHRWEKEYEELQGGNETLEKLIEEKKVLGDLLKKSANELTEKRKIAAEKLSREICAQLAYLDMPSIQLSFALTQEKVTITGMDGVQMLIAVNKGEEPKPLAKIASGGELSRIMLAIKSVLARNRNNDISAMIFDEIDSGISGRAATKVALKLSELSKERQVLCVTHLAQIAAMADNHLLIEKKERDNRTFTSVYPLSDAERKKELARMISGDEDEISLANAERLLSRAYL